MVGGADADAPDALKNAGVLREAATAIRLDLIEKINKVSDTPYNPAHHEDGLDDPNE